MGAVVWALLWVLHHTILQAQSLIISHQQSLSTILWVLHRTIVQDQSLVISHQQSLSTILRVYTEE